MLRGLHVGLNLQTCDDPWRHRVLLLEFRFRRHSLLRTSHEHDTGTEEWKVLVLDCSCPEPYKKTDPDGCRWESDHGRWYRGRKLNHSTGEGEMGTKP